MTNSIKSIVALLERLLDISCYDEACGCCDQAEGDVDAGSCCDIYRQLAELAGDELMEIIFADAVAWLAANKVNDCVANNTAVISHIWAF